MANFKRKVWESRLVENFNEMSVLPVLTTAPSEMTGESVTFNRANAGTIADYTGSINWEAVETTPIVMTFEHKKYFAFSVDDVDKVQTNIDLVDGFAQGQVANLSEAADTYAYTKFATGAGTKITDKEITAPEDLYDAIVDLGVALGKKRVPVANRYVLIDWEALGLLCKDKRFTHNPDVLANGIVSGQKISGMAVVVSANLPANTVIALYKGAVGFGQQINELEGMRLQGAFADGIRGLSVAGAAVLNPDGVAAMTYTIPEDEG